MKIKLPDGRAPAVVLINPKYEHNVGGVLRACSCFDIGQLWWTGDRVIVDKGKGQRLCREERMRGYADVDWNHCHYPFDRFQDGTPVCIELLPGAEPLTLFEHPDNAIYVFGPEDGSVPQVIRKLCHRFVYIPARHCLNLAVATGAVLAHRLMSRQQAGKEPILPISEMLKDEKREKATTPTLEALGWDGY
jgi:tRNA(Leu) C34 or U34 (ribose-2'-O)-methylase TrmL